MNTMFSKAMVTINVLSDYLLSFQTDVSNDKNDIRYQILTAGLSLLDLNGSIQENELTSNTLKLLQRCRFLYKLIHQLHMVLLSISIEDKLFDESSQYGFLSSLG